MSIEKRIGNKIILIPDPKQNPSWGEDTTAALEVIADAVANLFGANDLLTATANISNNQLIEADINGLKFNVAEVLEFNIPYYIKRVYDSGTSVSVESGIIEGHYDGSDCFISREKKGDTGISIDITSSGQLTYTSSDLTDHVSSIIYFKADTIDS